MSVRIKLERNYFLSIYRCKNTDATGNSKVCCRHFKNGKKENGGFLYDICSNILCFLVQHCNELAANSRYFQPASRQFSYSCNYSSTITYLKMNSVNALAQVCNLLYTIVFPLERNFPVRETRWLRILPQNYEYSYRN